MQRLCKSHHLQCITSSKYSEKLEKYLCVRDKAEDLCWIPWSSGPQTTLHHSSHDSVIDITKWAQEYFQKPLSVNTIRRAICRCQLKLYHAKRKPYVNMVQKRRRVLWAKAHLKWIVSKWKSGQTSPNLTFLLEITDAVSSGLKRRETFQRVISVQFKTSISDGMWVHKCMRYGLLACFGKHYEC